MTRIPNPAVESFLRQAYIQLDWLNSECSKINLSFENRESNLQAIEHSRQELLSLIEEVS
jgi:hypothetical protein